jgi:UDP-N-acetylglucosamine 2-epimerase (non-hydrolysing)
MHFVGNTMIDSLKRMEHRFRGANAAARFGLRPGDYLLVTLHRPALVDGPLLGRVLERLGDLARELPVLFPAHPRTLARIEPELVPPGVLVVEPVPYLDFLSLEADAAAVLTDSGGVQEETTYLGVPCFTLRANTERPVTVRLGTNTVLGLDPDRIADIGRLLDAPRRNVQVPPLWDGEAAERAAGVVAAVLDGAA